MEKREELRKTVVIFLSKSGPCSAREIYEERIADDTGLKKSQHIRSFRSFVKIINAFPEIKKEPTNPMTYKAK